MMSRVLGWCFASTLDAVASTKREPMIRTSRVFMVRPPGGLWPRARTDSVARLRDGGACVDERSGRAHARQRDIGRPCVRRRSISSGAVRFVDQLRLVDTLQHPTPGGF